MPDCQCRPGLYLEVDSRGQVGRAAVLLPTVTDRPVYSCHSPWAAAAGGPARGVSSSSCAGSRPQLELVSAVIKTLKKLGPSLKSDTLCQCRRLSQV